MIAKWFCHGLCKELLSYVGFVELASSDLSSSHSEYIRIYLFIHLFIYLFVYLFITLSFVNKWIFWCIDTVTIFFKTKAIKTVGQLWDCC